MLLPLTAIENILLCPVSGEPLMRSADRNEFQTADNQHHYPVIDTIPVLVDFSTSVLTLEGVRMSGGGSLIKRSRYSTFGAWAKRLASQQKVSTVANVETIRRMLNEKEHPRVLVVGGGSIGGGMEGFYEDSSVGVVAFDIYGTENVQFVADGHAIPLADDSFDGVIIQAVLEHVVYPDTVVAEAYRVLKPDGFVYAETPFMQQVHEGAYDFTRFTDSGHRNLFRQFEAIGSGSSGGPGVALMGSIDYFVRSLFRSRKAGKIAKLCFFWLGYFDNLIPENYAIDAASGLFFLGRKSSKTVAAREIVDYYQGAE